jgi:hypothetical protein
MEEGANVATKKFVITVTSKLFGKSASFRSKGKKGRKDVVVVEGLQTESPILSGCSVNEYQCIFETTN